MPGQALRMAVQLKRLRRQWQTSLVEPPPILLTPAVAHECIIEGFASTTAVALRIRQNQNLQGPVQLLQLSLDDIRAFASGSDNLPDTSLNILAKYILGSCRYDGATDKLVSTGAPATLTASYHPKWDRTNGYPPSGTTSADGSGVADRSTYTRPLGWS
jgi:hypothetical protein